MSHTPGPWVVFPFHDGSSISIESLKFGDIAEVVLCRDVAIVTANAHLIAAAPDLLEACKLVIDLQQMAFNAQGSAGGDVLERRRANALLAQAEKAIREAIAKATLPRQTDITSDVVETTLGVTGIESRRPDSDTRQGWRVPEPILATSPLSRASSKPQYASGCDATGRNLDTTV